jgi:hypothetical protein
METPRDSGSDGIFQASDLSGKRREVMNGARNGIVRIRDTDGMGLVMLPQRTFEFLSSARHLLAKFTQLEAALGRPRKDRRVADYGEFAWLAAFDSDDEATFRLELVDAITQSLGTESTDPVEACIHAWRTTASALSTDRVRKALTTPGDDAYEEVKRPG